MDAAHSVCAGSCPVGAHCVLCSHLISAGCKKSVSAMRSERVAGQQSSYSAERFLPCVSCRCTHCRNAVSVNTIGLSMTAASQSVLRLNLLHKCALPLASVSTLQSFGSAVNSAHPFSRSSFASRLLFSLCPAEHHILLLTRLLGPRAETCTEHCQLPSAPPRPVPWWARRAAVP